MCTSAPCGLSRTRVRDLPDDGDMTMNRALALKTSSLWQSSLHACVALLWCITSLIVFPSIGVTAELGSLDWYYAGEDDSEFCRIINRTIGEAEGVTVHSLTESFVVIEYVTVRFLLMPWTSSDDSQKDILRVITNMTLSPEGSTLAGKARVHRVLDDVNSDNYALKCYLLDDMAMFETTIQFKNELHGADIISACAYLMITPAMSLIERSGKDRVLFGLSP